MHNLKSFNRSENNVLTSTMQLHSNDIGMKFGIEHCGILITKMGKMTKCNGIKVPNGEEIKEVSNKGYKCLCILGADKTKKKIKDVFKKEYFRRIRLILKSK